MTGDNYTLRATIARGCVALTLDSYQCWPQKGASSTKRSFPFALFCGQFQVLIIRCRRCRAVLVKGFDQFVTDLDLYCLANLLVPYTYSTCRHVKSLMCLNPICVKAFSRKSFPLSSCSLIAIVSPSFVAAKVA